MIELGGNIKLEGFENAEPKQMIVVRKMVGTFARKFSDEIEGFESLQLNLEGKAKHKIKAILTVKGKIKETNGEDKNLFFAISTALNKLQTK